jgi:flagellar capping protein FliD
MSESAITAWEKKAQTGLLRSDSTISSFLQQMTESFYTTVDKAGIAAYSVGIESTQNDLTGKLTFDESLFRTALASDPDAVSSLFTDSTSGLSTMLAKAMDGAAKLSSASPGSLVQLAGADGWTANAKNNDIYIELQTINDKLDDLQDKYDDEKERYWTKFNSMETAITKYQSQSAQITSSFSS